MSIVSNRGEVTIPKRFLHALGITPGVEVDFEQKGDALLLRAHRLSKNSRVEDGPKILNYTGSAVTLDEMEAAVRKGVENFQ